ncbi:MAG: L-seryl-tRNA(Ser) seleniumtransferase [Candidatus Poribacteria bacterium]|nr:L-seryl-tRNA(Ser) seleniumtransferase [Candidatus Poribacteria bacterium]
MNSEFNKYLRQLPSVNKVMEQPEITGMAESCPHTVIVKAVREVIDILKNRILSAKDEEYLTNIDLSIESIIREVEIIVRQNNRMSLRRAINATGDVLRDDLGRSPLNEFAQKSIQDVAKRYSTLSVRDSHLQDLLSYLTGAESSLIVNNNTASILLILNTICKDKEVVISRGELIENDDSRLPEIIEQSGANLVSIGTTNKTHLYDYRKAINENTGAIMKANTGNYRISGFTEQVPLIELVKLAKEYNLPIIDNIGSGCLVDMTQMGFPEEPYVPQSIQRGADIVCFSGDKLLGGPQAGIIVGKSKYISIMQDNPLYRTLRPDKLIITALEATLRSYLDTDMILKHNVALQLLCRPLEEIASIAKALTENLKSKLDGLANISIVEGYSKINSVSFSLETFPTKFVIIEPTKMSTQELAEKLLTRDVPIFVNVYADSISVDPRTIWADEIDEITYALSECAKYIAP